MVNYRNINRPNKLSDISVVGVGPIFFYRISTPHQKAIFVGSLDDPNEFEIKMEVCTSSSVSWLQECGTTPSYAEKPEGMTPTLNYHPVTGGTS